MMFTTVDKAIAGGVVSFVANWLAAHYGLTLPADVQTAITGLIVALFVWLTPNVEKVIDKAQQTPPIGGPGSPNAGAKG